MFVGENNYNYHSLYGLPAQRLFRGALPIECRRLLSTVQDRKAIRQSLRRQFRIPDHAFVVLFCGKLTPGKRPLDVVRAAHILSRTSPVWALIVGEGERRVPIEALCKAEGVQNVRLAGFVNQSKISHYYAAAEIIAVTSDLDAHPLVVSEAACFGLPVIISDKVGCIGSNDSAQPGRNAIVYPCGNVQALASAIDQLWRDRDLYQRMSCESSEIAASQDVTVAAEQLASAVRQLRDLGLRPPAGKRYPRFAVSA